MLPVVDTNISALIVTELIVAPAGIDTPNPPNREETVVFFTAIVAVAYTALSVYALVGFVQPVVTTALAVAKPLLVGNAAPSAGGELRLLYRRIDGMIPEREDGRANMQINIGTVGG